MASSQRLEGNAANLLPGLQNHVVLGNIVPKLPWRTFHILSCVSLHWRDAIQSRQVYDARVRSNSLETLVVLNHPDPDDAATQAIYLFSSRNNSWHQLPDFPFYENGIPRSCQCVAFDGRLYVLGGETEDDYPDPEDAIDEDDDGQNSEDSDYRSIVPRVGEVFVLDLVGQRGWKQCAILPKHRYGFACGVLDGKVYVLGGTTGIKVTNECWVYEPKENRWSSISPMTSERNGHHVVAAGDKLWVHGGWFGLGRRALYPEVYDPAKDKWDHIEPQHSHASGHMFTVKDKLYLVTPTSIYWLEELSKGKSWTHLHTISMGECLGSENVDDLEVIAAQAVDAELLVLFLWSCGRVLYRSRGFGTEKEKIELEIVHGKELFEYPWHPPFMCSIEL